MKILANSIKLGNILLYHSDLWEVIKTPEHTKPGKGGAYIQVEMKNLRTGSKVNERFSSSIYVERANLEQKKFKFLYIELENLVFMDNKTFEQILICKQSLNNKLPFLLENMLVDIEFYEEKPINIKLPNSVILSVIQTEPVIKGATVTCSYKPAILSNSVRIMVPSYIMIGDRLLINTNEASFIEKVK